MRPRLVRLWWGEGGRSFGIHSDCRACSQRNSRVSYIRRIGIKISACHVWRNQAGDVWRRHTGLVVGGSAPDSGRRRRRRVVRRHGGKVSEMCSCAQLSPPKCRNTGAKRATTEQRRNAASTTQGSNTLSPSVKSWRRVRRWLAVLDRWWGVKGRQCGGWRGLRGMEKGPEAIGKR